MNDSTLQKAFIDRGCFPHQTEFAVAFFAPNAARKHWLVSAPGMGKGFASAAIVHHALSTGLAHRVLILTPSARLAQWNEEIRRFDAAAPVMVVDRRRLRELEDSQPVGQEIWPANAVVVLSLDLAKQADVAAALTRCTWDLLLVDEVQLASPQTHRAKVVLDLMRTWPQMRVLLLQVGGHWTTAEPGVSELLHDAAVTVWTRESVRDHQGRPLLPEVRMEWIAYRRPPEEAEVLARLQDTVRSLDMTSPEMRLTAATLLQSASSSPFALEQRLRRMRQRRNELVHGVEVNPPTEIEAEEVGMDAPEGGNTGELIRGYVELSRAAEPLLKLLEELPSDSKCEALVGLLNSVGTIWSPDRRTCVFTRFIDTATYLASTLQELCPHVWVMTGGSSFADREKIVADFAHAGGVLLATESVETPGPEVAAVVFYDLPLKPAVLEARIGQFVRFGRRGPIRLVAFTDESNALAIERLQRKIADVKEALSEEEIDQTLFSKESK
jgi:ERCC4-related helicase